MTKKGDTPDDNSPLKLTRQQRESLLRHTRLKRSIRQKVEQAGEGTKTVLVTRQELDDLNGEIGQAAVYATGPDKKRLLAVLRKVAHHDVPNGLSRELKKPKKRSKNHSMTRSLMIYEQPVV